ncbi:surface carbohydrate biosynthesis protein [Alkalilimnicola ehrlichii MLHE-1]|uniref:Surface carbohydrate biosynthesis protein n=1 Tax=Alkalilimnicola ehrlichii (strain ATCC BAA-1101 / DSM 17681 / MLHE-1) TaxID=187272 RepID=Q0A666_ALKEH|nr:surface carbohydrate biosynthesis protein [Alkalilimnicola ehrlichii]ABI57671.1 hypothetical protein Mlg_2331 [Alkalilimnicola ehrlichii MLHE-1]
MHSKKKTLYILMELKRRELEGKMLLAHEAAAQGFRVILGSQDYIKRAFEYGFFPPGIYMDKSLAKAKARELNKRSKEGCVIVSQDEEGGFLDRDSVKFVKFRSSGETVSAASAIFAWGELDADGWKYCYPQARDKIFITGSPRVDFWRKDFESFFSNDIDRIQEEYGSFVLIPSNFSLANPLAIETDLLEQAKQSGRVQSAREEREFLKLIEDIGKIFDEYVSLINYLADIFPEVNFVVRPHPSEDKGAWGRRLSHRKNIYVVPSGGISQWVRASSLIIHNGCTTGLEAYVSKKPVLAFEPFNSAANREIPNYVSYRVETKEDVRWAIEEVILQKKGLSGDDQGPKGDLVAKRLANSVSMPASEKIVETLKTFHVPAAASPSSWRLHLVSLRIFMANGFSLARKGVAIQSKRKFPFLTSGEVTDLHNKLVSIKPEFKKCACRKMYGDVFIIEADRD